MSAAGHRFVPKLPNLVAAGLVAVAVAGGCEGSSAPPPPTMMMTAGTTWTDGMAFSNDVETQLGPTG